MSNGLERLRTLLVDERRHLKEVLAPILKGAGLNYVDYAWDRRQAIGAMGLDGPHLAFIDYDPEPAAMLQLVKLMRRPTAHWNYKLPIIILATTLSHEQICAARDGGVNEILIKPLTTAAVVDRLSRVILKPRPFITSERYRGPERRRRASVTFNGPFRRRSDPR